jgi:hypothetical protein
MEGSYESASNIQGSPFDATKQTSGLLWEPVSEKPAICPVVSKAFVHRAASRPGISLLAPSITADARIKTSPRKPKTRRMAVTFDFP